MSTPGRSGINGEDIRREILHRIFSGAWKAGERLPSCRQIASEFGSNANTVNRELQRLAAEGVVRSEPRRGTYVTGSSSWPVLSTGLQQEVKDLIRRAQAIGFSRDDLVDLIDQSFNDTLDPEIAFVECNTTDLARMAELIANATGIQTTPVLIDELAERDVATSFDLIVTPLFHFAEVLEAIGDQGRILELNFTASSGTLRKIAELSTDRVVTVAAPTPSGAERTAALIRTVFRGTIVELVPTQSSAAVFSEVDVLVYVNALQLSNEDLAGPEHCVRIDWQLDGMSAELLRRQVADLGARASTFTTSG
ncbi:GntR family transcriptional regulator [Candidatus Poriferisocius sp.]|uniref:GntR family transcriptional regulator n=1 Tax=Candidatus Poriferisocius sp. TaxID=3101276 RepID=UPI003B02DFCF